MFSRLSRQIRVPRPPARGRGRRLLALVILTVPLVVGGVGTYGTPPQTRGDELSDAQAREKALAAKIAAEKAQLARLAALQAGLSADIAQTKSTLSGVNADLAAVKAQVANLSLQIGLVQQTYNGLVIQIADLNAQISRIAMAGVVKNEQLAERKGILADRLRAAYTAGQTSLLETILSARSFSDALADVGYYLDIGSQDKALAVQIASDEADLVSLQQVVTDTLNQTADLQAQTAAQKLQLDAKLGDLKQAKQQLAVLQAETQRQLALQATAYQELHLSRAAAAAALAREARAQAEVRKKIADLIAQQFANGNIPSVYNGSLQWPLAGIITQEFGCTGVPQEPPLGNCSHFHIGIDIAAPMYTPIRAAGAGRVVYEGPLSDGAWVVIIAHSQSLVTLYGHVDNRGAPPVVRAGDLVAQGQIIAYVGMTGNTTGPHLHWAVELNGTWVNPRLFL
ncbi:MAG: murein hydrolase activator EnvC family protein [Candidatus Limnocylindrales bacterium]